MFADALPSLTFGFDTGSGVVMLAALFTSIAISAFVLIRRGVAKKWVALGSVTLFVAVVALAYANDRLLPRAPRRDYRFHPVEPAKDNGVPID